MPFDEQVNICKYLESLFLDKEFSEQSPKTSFPRESIEILCLSSKEVSVELSLFKVTYKNQ